jgi:hypothetical protein
VVKVDGDNNLHNNWIQTNGEDDDHHRLVIQKCGDNKKKTKKNQLPTTTNAHTIVVSLPRVLIAPSSK